MKATVVILPTLAEQEAAGDSDLIDPEVIDLTEWEGHADKRSPLFRDFNFTVPEGIVGSWTNPRLQDGRLVVDVELDDSYDRLIEQERIRFAYSGIHGGGVGRLIAVGAIWAKPPKEG